MVLEVDVAKSFLLVDFASGYAAECGECGEEEVFGDAL